MNTNVEGQKMTESRMAEVAKLFGKELGEEFIINEHPSRYFFLYKKKEKSEGLGY